MARKAKVPGKKPAKSGAAKPAKKPGRAKKPGPATTPGAVASGGPKVRVRMYRQGLGDCFLLTFGEGAAAEHVLIDCGSLGTTTNPANTMTKVVEDIRATTGGKLALLVATHEHKDHVSGFGSRREVFDGFEVANVWLAWTEDRADDLARKIAEYKQDMALAVGTSLRVASVAGHSARADAARDLLEFSGEAAKLGADDFAETIDRAMSFVRDKGGTRTKYLRPSEEPVQLGAVPGFRFYVLGPPRDEKALAIMGDHGNPELYGLRAAAVTRMGIEGTRTLDESEAARCELEMPFDVRHRIGFKSKEPAAAFYPEYYGGEEWRRVDDDWLGSASDLALQLDNLTNNTSLALAIERIADGRVLLFPADAQLGHWQSWHVLKWKVDAGNGAEREVVAKDLLARTVFYKVGHHASHNATARGKGLEMMTREDELTAFIPVDRAVALGRSPKGSWKMPARPLYRRLLEKCQGRVVRSDVGWADDSAGAADRTTEGEFDGMATRAEWTEWKRKQAAASVKVEPMFVEFTLG